MSNHAKNADAELGITGWRKPWSGSGGGNCVEAKEIDDCTVALRQSTDPQGPALVFARPEIAAFVRGAKKGDADFLL